MSLSTETLVADPQVPRCWFEQRLDQRFYHGVNQLPAIWYPNHGAAFGEGELLDMGLAHQYSTTPTAIATTRNRQGLSHSRSQEGDGRSPWQQIVRAQPGRAPAAPQP
jgi:hypothetical protein